MHIGKEEIMAIIECVLLFLGAVFLAIVFLDSSNPLWALWVGVLFALAGVGVWISPWATKKFKEIQATIAARTPKVKTEKKTPVEKPVIVYAPEDETYELHRPTSYNNYNDSDLDF